MVSKIQSLLSSGETEKKAYHEALKSAEVGVRAHLDSVGYKYEDMERVSLFKDTTDTRLARANEKREQFAKNPELAAADYVKYASGLLESFLKHYNIGWLHEFNMTKYGMFAVDISCSIHLPFDNSESAKLLFEKQLNTLREVGFELQNDRFNGQQLASTAKNQELLTELISSRGGKSIEIHLRGNAIRSVEFRISPENVENFNEDVLVIKFDVSDKLNQDEVHQANKLVKGIGEHLAYAGMDFAYGSEGANIPKLAAGLIESEFAELCEIFAYEGEISKTVRERHKESREKNQTIRSIEENIGSLFPQELAKDTIKDIYGRIGRFSVEKLGFNVLDFSIDKYGIISVKLGACTGFPIGRKPLSEEETSKLFQTVGQSRRMDNFWIVDSTENKKTLSNILFLNIPSCDICEIISRESQGEFGIRTITMYIRNILDVFKLPSEDEDNII